MRHAHGAELEELRQSLLAITSPAAARRMAHGLAAGRASTSVSMDDTVALVEIAAAVARDASLADFERFVRTGRLPDLVALGPRQMEHIRGGRANLTAQRGMAPELVLAPWLSRGDRT